MFDRIKIRGVHAVVAGMGVTVAAAVMGPAVMARGAEAAHHHVATRPAVEARGVMRLDLMAARHPRLVHHARRVHRTRPRHEVASRTTSRAPLTSDPRGIAHALLLREGQSDSQWGCLDALWSRESGWSTYASNGSSGAYGIPQALPGDKMASFGADWRTNPITQIRWGLWYIGQTYGTPCAALSHSQAYGYY